MISDPPSHGGRARTYHVVFVYEALGEERDHSEHPTFRDAARAAAELSRAHPDQLIAVRWRETEPS